MTILVAVVTIVMSIGLLTGGGELLVKGAIALARAARVRPAIIGLTIVAFGTSVPELAVSVFAAVQGSTDVALGNVVGSNILNVALIVGLSALITTLPVHGQAIAIEWPFMFASSCLAVVIGWSGEFTRFEGALLVMLLLAFNVLVVRDARRKVRGPERTKIANEVSHMARAALARGVILNVTLIVVGIALLVSGGYLLVRGAVTVARLAGVTERVIGLTVVAIGTSMPELTTSIVAARRGHADLAVANVIGSNIFNILGVLGTVALVHPVAVSGRIEFDMLWMLGFSLMLAPMMRDKKVSRFEGALLVSAWLVYLSWLLHQAPGA